MGDLRVSGGKAPGGSHLRGTNVMVRKSAKQCGGARARVRARTLGGGDGFVSNRERKLPNRKRVVDSQGGADWAADLN